jgi:NAD(P)-dependent dehydrogenase (short-subunit alcohol dehydrogenase family)
MGKFVCVTGADRGVGFELARQLLQMGYVVFAGHYLKDWSLLAELNKEHKDNLHLVELDISSDESVKAAREYIASKTSKLDIIINNGAILGDISKTINDELDFEEIQKVFNVTALGALRVSNSLMSLLLNSENKLLVNISSEAGSIANCARKGWFGYCMSKAALNMNSALVHNNLKEIGGQVLVIHPGWVKTYMQGKLDEAATITPMESAENILKLVMNHKEYFGDKPAYLDYLGEKMEW